jgi:hypothetical protein
MPLVRIRGVSTPSLLVPKFMKFLSRSQLQIVLGFVFLSAALPSEGQVLTVQVGAPPPPATALVNHGDSWRYRKGLSAPQTDWRTDTDANLDATWLTGPGGFGYGDGDDATILADMVGGYNTVYIRKSFLVTGPVDPARRVVLTMDWDDGFVAYLDGSEVARSANVLVATPLFDSATAPNQNHEASAGGGSPPTLYDLGSVDTLLAPGTHVLAVHGLNSDTGSTDFSLIADLRLTGGSQVAGGGSLFAIVNSSEVQLSGTNTIAGATRVFVNGEPASFNPGTGQWSRTHNLAPGLNHLFVAAVDNTGALLGSAARDVLYQTASTPVGGVLASDTVWDGTSGTYHVTNTVIVPNGLTLRITNGAVVLLSPNASIRATTNGVVLATGTDAKPILFAPADGESPWGDLRAAGTNAALTLRHAEVVAGQISLLNGATVLMEDSVIRDRNDGGEVISADFGASLTLRRCYGARFGEMDAFETPVLIEDSLLERFAIDGLDIKGTNVPLVVRRTTLRDADPTNLNADGIDFGPGAGTVEQCLIHGFPDKGISLGGAPGTTVRDTLIYNCGIGISAYASINVALANATISRCSQGILFRNNPTPGIGVASNLIVWGNISNVVVSGTSALEINFSDVENTNWPGAANISADPLFIDPMQGDFRLAPGSPAIGAGLGGVDMGTHFPVGGLPATPRNLAATAVGTGEIRLVWQDDSANETGFQVERSNDGLTWASLTGVGPNVTNHVDVTAAVAQRYFYRVRSFNSSGVSRVSNPASAIREETMTEVGGILAGNNVWSPAMGMIVVRANVIVPAGATLTMLPGTVVKLTNNTSIIAASGGTIDIAGTAENKVQLRPLVTTNIWGQLSAQFTGSSLSVRHADIGYGQVTVYSNAVGLLEDSFIHNYRRAGGSLFTAPIILTHFAAPTIVRRCHVREYHETLWRNGILTIEQCLFEFIYGDAVDFDAAQTGTVIRHCTFRHGTLGNVDAVDVGPGDLPGAFDVRIENCMMYNFPFDKGVSVGDNNSSRGTIVSNCFIYGCLSGVMAKDRCDVSVRNCTIVGNAWGLTNYNKSSPSSPTGGGITTNSYNNIVWGNNITISMVNGSELYADHNNFGNTNWPGAGNIDVDPLFLNPGGRDYRLTPNSPCLGAGRDGADMGAHFPVGAPMVLSHPRIEAFDTSGANTVVRFWADNEKTYSLLCSPVVAGGTWVNLGNVPTGTVPRFLSMTNAIAPGSQFYRLVTPAMP